MDKEICALCKKHTGNYDICPQESADVCHFNPAKMEGSKMVKQWSFLIIQKLFMLISGCFFLLYGLIGMIITTPIWFFIFAYDLGTCDGKDRMGKFIDKWLFLGRGM